MYKIAYAEAVADDLRDIRASERTRILNRIEVQLKHEPARQTRNRKVLVGLVPPWAHVAPAWELRVGKYRIFYDVDEAVGTVIVRAIRQKLPHQATEEIL